jgi:hypothetical protein
MLIPALAPVVRVLSAAVWAPIFVDRTEDAVVAELLSEVVVDGVFDTCICEVVRAKPFVVDVLVASVDELPTISEEDVERVDGVFDTCICEVVCAKSFVVDVLVASVDELPTISEEDAERVEDTARILDEVIGALDWLELEPAGTTMPPCTVLDPSDDEVPAAALL